MARDTNPKNKRELHQAWRDKIRASVLINHLRNHVLGRIKLEATQIRAAEILLNRVMPTLQATDITASDADGQPLSIGLIAYHPSQLPTEALPVTDTQGTGLRH